ncbi:MULTISPECIES: inositol monophosphatase family protein [unclassified Mameliella]|uniref:inositol monophosphatase family protein n=1 Tax=unclassified Mameliella TaxID=2630630 RepID=UPI00273DCC0F|nr:MULTISPECIES: inositol monophosphatase family protein [unclassified Mameliella]
MDRISLELAQELIETAEALADAAGKAILPFFRQRGLTAENKDAGSGFDPVTAADRAAEQAMRAVLADRRPGDAILGEEYGTQTGTSGFTWVLDPIDGTRAFLAGTPTWGVLISVRDDSGPVYGIIAQPYTQERFRGGLSRSDFTGPHGAGPLGVRGTQAIDEAVLFTTFPEVGTPEDRAGFERVAARTRLVRYGMDCYAYALLAAGQIDLVIEAGLQAYDIQAPIAVIEAAGGIVTNWEGGPVHDGGRALAAATPELHATALDLLRNAG